MEVFSQKITALERFRDNIKGMIATSLRDNQADMLDSLKEQLLEGKGGSGENLRPLYSEDLRARGGWFHSAESAARYASYKEKITYPKNVVRDSDAPNLYWNGRFHSELAVVADDDKAMFGGGTPYASNIVNKYGIQNFGLTDWRMRVILETKVIPYLQEKLKEIL